MFDKIIFYDQIYNDYDFERINKSIIKDSWVKNPDYDNATRDVFSTSEIDKQLLPDMYTITDRYFNFLDPNQSSKLMKFTSGKFFYSIKFARYNINDDFKPHVDELSHGDAERIVSSITYINDDFEGGETEIMGKIITPKKNFTLTFPSNWAFLHQGMKVTKGIKKIMVVHFYATMNRVLL